MEQDGRVEVLGAAVPVSYWTIVSFFAGLAGIAAIWPKVADRVGWPRGYTLVELLALTLVLSLTLPPGEESEQPGLRECFIGGIAALKGGLTHFGNVSGTALNVLLFVPVGFGLAAATRKLWPAVTVSLLLPVVIEWAQTLLPGRECDSGDVAANFAGGLVGVVLAAVFVWRGRRARRLLHRVQ